MSKPPSNLWPVLPTEVYDTYWRFAAERQTVFFRKLNGCPPPWTNDVTLNHYKFTNAYRAADRVSQFLIRNVIYDGSQKPEDVFFRIVLFKVFNRIDTWLLLQKHLGEVSFATYSFDRYDDVLMRAMQGGARIFSAAYIMPSGKTSFSYKEKHRNYLRLIERMMSDGVPKQTGRAKSLKEVFEILRSYPMMGDFLAYQYSIDLNYSELVDFSEMEFVVAGPGARDGIRKCFSNLGGLNEVQIIRLLAERQDYEFKRLGIRFLTLFGRPLQLIDCQNLFCEVDKYARHAHPHVKGKSSRTRIKQIYRQSASNIEYWFPPKWGLASSKVTAGGDTDVLCL